jgi:ribosomal protein L28
MCGKSYNIAQKRKKLRGKYNPVKKYKQKANLHKTRLYREDGKVSLVCSKCLKTLTKKASISHSKS